MIVNQAGRAVERTMKIEGVVIPAIIHNSSYFFVNLPIYADGLIDAWELVDLPIFEKKLRCGWVTTQIPDGENISIHGLGCWEVQNGQWNLTPDDMLALIKQRINELNPHLRNLYDCYGETTKRIGNMTVSILGSPRAIPVRPKDTSSLPRLARGRSLSVFVREEHQVYLADLRVFDDGIFEIGRTPSPRVLSKAQLVAAVEAGQVFSQPSQQQPVTIHGLGTFIIGEALWEVSIDQILLETSDLVDEILGRPDSVQRCRECYEKYLASPTHEAKAALKAAYEAVPKHNRMYVGDMDTKDVGVRMILYGEQEIEAWSHRAVARAQGVTPLPTIVLPVSQDEDE